MIKPKEFENKERLFKTLGKAGLVLLILYVTIKGFKGGNDINVYLHTGSQFLNGEDIYSSNPFNRYLYSPFFAMIMAPLSAIPWELSRVIWGLLNVLLSYRCYSILKTLIPKDVWEKKPQWFWACGFILISFNSFNHNLILGQMTVIILWMTLEGLFHVFRGKEWKGAALLALGMNIKILPALAIAYIFFKGKVKASFLAAGFLIATLLIPALFIGFQENLALHTSWLNEINPSGDRYAWENNTGCISLNCILPNYFLAKPETYIPKIDFDTVLFPLSDEALVMAINLSRLLILLGLIWMIVRHRKNSDDGLNLYKEWSLVLLATLLIFPHQMKYSMLYATPALIYFWMDWLRNRWNGHNSPWLLLALMLGIVSALLGRDILGDLVVDTFDQVRFMGLSVLYLYVLLLVRDKSLTHA